ncbi:McrC family protein [Mesorhizobium sp. M0664]|uniref:McrC family protein n=1 Tax=Mesorhizobium sp. M0664 TaxID=2956982 RepID=UPI00333818AE
MTHLSVLEWDRVAVGDGGLTRCEADQLLASARVHSLGGVDGAQILTDHHRWLRSQQMVGVIAGDDCSLEILPKIDQLGDAQSLQGKARLRHRLVQMLDVALGLEIGLGRETALARQDETLLDILIRSFADRLTNEVRRGLPRQYLNHEDELPVLRGRLDIARQFTALAARADRLSCRFDVLSADTPLLQIMKTCVVVLSRYARREETSRRLSELRLALVDVSDVRPRELPWDAVAINRSNLRWRSLLNLAELLLRRNWQATHRGSSADARTGLTLLFPMNGLFEAYVSALLRAALAPLSYEVVSQGGFRHCVLELAADGAPARPLFRTKPDCLVRKDGQTVLVLDTKWKRLSTREQDAKRGVSQSDVYQMMAYARLYGCTRLMLLYPFHPDLERRGSLARHRINVDGADERLDIASIDIAAEKVDTVAALKELVLSIA